MKNKLVLVRAILSKKVVSFLLLSILFISLFLTIGIFATSEIIPQKAELTINITNRSDEQLSDLLHVYVIDLENRSRINYSNATVSIVDHEELKVEKIENSGIQILLDELDSNETVHIKMKGILLSLDFPINLKNILVEFESHDGLIFNFDCDIVFLVLAKTYLGFYSVASIKNWNYRTTGILEPIEYRRNQVIAFLWIFSGLFSCLFVSIVLFFRYESMRLKLPIVTIIIALCSVSIYSFFGSGYEILANMESPLLRMVTYFSSYLLHGYDAHLNGNLIYFVIASLLMESWLDIRKSKNEFLIWYIFPIILTLTTPFMGLGSSIGLSLSIESLTWALWIRIIYYKKCSTKLDKAMCIFAGLPSWIFFNWTFNQIQGSYELFNEVLAFNHIIYGLVTGIVIFGIFSIWWFSKHMFEKDIRAIALVLAGAFLGTIPSILFTGVTLQIVGVISLLAIVGFFLLIYGVGIPQDLYKQHVLSNRWKKPLKIGILFDLKWDIGDTETYAWTDISPKDWKATLENFAENKMIEISVDLINIKTNFDSYTVILNPYGGVYPEADLRTLSTLDKITEYVKNGGIFVNVADIPTYWAYNPEIRRKVDTTPSVFEAIPTQAGTQMQQIRPFALTPLAKTLGLQILKLDKGIAQDLRGILGPNIRTQIISKRATIVESNVESGIQPKSLTFNDEKIGEMSALFFVKYGEGYFLMSLIWITDPEHDDHAKESLKKAISKLIINKLSSLTET